MQTDSMSCIDEVRILHDTVAIVLHSVDMYTSFIHHKGRSNNETNKQAEKKRKT